MKETKELNVLEYELPIRIEKDPSGGFVASSPAWQDCYAQGDSLDETMNEIISVASSLIELYKEEGLKIPLHSTTSKKSTFKVPVLTSS